MAMHAGHACWLHFACRRDVMRARATLCAHARRHVCRRDATHARARAVHTDRDCCQSHADACQTVVAAMCLCIQTVTAVRAMRMRARQWWQPCA
eukprot:163101-Chlamydomonas_euryale.AAC.4